VTALGGNAPLRRGEPADLEHQRGNLRAGGRLAGIGRLEDTAAILQAVLRSLSWRPTFALRPLPVRADESAANA
jgi:hypothetical protein